MKVVLNLLPDTTARDLTQSMVETDVTNWGGKNTTSYHSREWTHFPRLPEKQNELMVSLVTQTLSVQWVVNPFGLAYLGFDGGGDIFNTFYAYLFFRMEDNSSCSDKDI